jgi:hypothetical protein
MAAAIFVNPKTDTEREDAGLDEEPRCPACATTPSAHARTYDGMEQTMGHGLGILFIRVWTHGFRPITRVCGEGLR